MKKGMTLIETLLYAALLTIITTVVLDLFLVNANAWGKARSLRNTNDGGKLIMERLIQEIRLASSVNSIASGSIELGTFLSPTSTTPSTLQIFLDGQTVKSIRDGASAEILSGNSIRVTNLNFQKVDSGLSDIVRVELTVESSQGRFLTERDFTSAVMLKGGF